MARLYKLASNPRHYLYLQKSALHSHIETEVCVPNSSWGKSPQGKEVFCKGSEVVRGIATLNPPCSLVSFSFRWWTGGRTKAVLKRVYLLRPSHRTCPSHLPFTGAPFLIQQRPLTHGSLTHMSSMRNREPFMKVGVSDSHVKQGSIDSGRRQPGG